MLAGSLASSACAGTAHRGTARKAATTTADVRRTLLTTTSMYVEVVVSKVLRTSAVVVAAFLAVPLWAVPAHAELAKEPASMGAYFYRQGVTQPAGTPDSPQPIPNVTANADGVSPGNLAVAAQGGQEDKVSFLSFALAAAPLEGTIDSAVLSVPLVASSPPND